MIATKNKSNPADNAISDGAATTHQLTLIIFNTLSKNNTAVSA